MIDNKISPPDRKHDIQQLNATLDVLANAIKMEKECILRQKTAKENKSLIGGWEGKIEAGGKAHRFHIEKDADVFFVTHFRQERLK
jgi:hypothetical protein